jgi:phenylalanyl-tRNA synthetase alpha chain
MLNELDLKNLKENFQQQLVQLKQEEQVKELRASFLGKKSSLGNLLRNLENIPTEQRQKLGILANQLKNFMMTELANCQQKFSAQKVQQALNAENIDITLPPRKVPEGYQHPISKVCRDFMDILIPLGFSYTSGSELESDWNCFGGLNIPAHHPARQMQDTFYLQKDILLRTQTTSLQMTEMLKEEPPYKFFTYGKTFRSEMDATHTPMFHQLDVAYVDTAVSLQDLKNCLLTLLRKFFDLKTMTFLRFRPSYFPFVSIGMEVDVRCNKKSNTNQLTLGVGDDWLEILGCGMIHPQVLRNVHLDPQKFQGFAFAFGLDRMAMLKYGVKDLRNLYGGHIPVLHNYGIRIFD